MSNPYNRHDLTDENWNKLEPLITELLGKWGGCNANDNRLFVNACLWIIRTGSPWRDLPNGYGKFNAVHRRYKRWCDKGIWDKLLAELIDEPDYEWLMIDASHCKVHPHAAGAVGGNQDMGRNKRGLNTKIHLVVEANGNPIKFMITGGEVSDFTEAVPLITGLKAENLIADKGYDSDEIVRFAKKQGMNPVIPPRKNRNEQREYDKHLYKLRHLVENAFLKLKRFRGIATRYTKTTSAFRGAVTLAAISLWLNLV
ncbi:IS5 family transposase [Bacillus mycoides]